jgi:hypothetical protein
VKPDFSGEYVLDRAASALSAGAAAIETALLRIEHDEPRFRCSARFSSAEGAIEFNFERHTDGREHVASAHEASRCVWEEDAIVSEDRMGSPEAPVIMTWRYQLTDGGRRLRATERIRGGGRDQDNVWEFARQ